jgi:hypothetical protein
MAEDDQDREKGAPSLEPPSLFGRKKRKPQASVAVPAETPVDDVTAEFREAVAPADDDPTTILDEPTEVSDGAPEPMSGPASEAADDATIGVSSLTPPPAPERPQEPRAPHEPWVTGRPAAVLAGLLVGALIVTATAGSLRLCTEVKGTSSCGNSGFFLLVAILVGAVLVGAVVLRAARVPEPGSTSFLAVGLLSVVALLFLVGQLFEWWMIIVIPIVSVATFLLSHWVTTTYIDPANDGSDREQQPEPHDIR